ncbi:adhesive plaque matrix protein-like [Cherax quadricarinatus]|uniref:adhesive plaque matrix protein-like n=1 Tax=Cherax quadricarinatus TaxID=27406 RepID=UPI0023792E95|nr:adhesive plaque matrix protein-like [Cherax quadricarinatus]
MLWSPFQLLGISVPGSGYQRSRLWSPTLQALVTNVADSGHQRSRLWSLLWMLGTKSPSVYKGDATEVLSLLLVGVGVVGESVGIADEGLRKPTGIPFHYTYDPHYDVTPIYIPKNTFMDTSSYPLTYSTPAHARNYMPKPTFTPSYMLKPTFTPSYMLKPTFTPSYMPKPTFTPSYMLKPTFTPKATYTPKAIYSPAYTPKLTYTPTPYVSKPTYTPTPYVPKPPYIPTTYAPKPTYTPAYTPKPTYTSKPTYTAPYTSSPKSYVYKPEPFYQTVYKVESAYKPSPTHDDGPTEYDFGYGVADTYHGTNFGHTEKREGYRTEGQYFVDLPDGRRMVVKYYSDETGYHPTITYEGTPIYPQHRPVYKPKPAYKSTPIYTPDAVYKPEPEYKTRPTYKLVSHNEPLYRSDY